MDRNDFQAFSKIVVGFAALRNRQLTKEAIETYWRAMQDWSLDEFQQAADILTLECEFMPLPHDFQKLRKRVTETAPEAWIEVLRRARRGDFDLAGLSSVARAAVSALGGIRTVAMSETAHTHFLEKRFCEHYVTMQDAYVARSGKDAISYLERERLTHTEN